LERRGVLVGDWEDETVASAEQRPPRRYYSLTDVGDASLEDVMARFPVLMRLFDEAPEGH